MANKVGLQKLQCLCSKDTWLTSNHLPQEYTLNRLDHLMWSNVELLTSLDKLSTYSVDKVVESSFIQSIFESIDQKDFL